MSDLPQEGSWLGQRQRIGQQVLTGLYESHLLKTWRRDQPEGWELVSGYWSPFYFQLRNLPSCPELFRQSSKAIAEVIKHECPSVNRLIGLAMAGVPLATAVALEMNIPMGYTRKVPGVRSASDLRMPDKDYGDHALVEGDLADGDRIILVDDVVARFTSKELGIAQVEAEAQRRGLSGVNVVGIAVLVDREQGGAETAAQFGISMHSPVKFLTEGLFWLRDRMPSRELDVIEDYLANQERYQDEAIQAELRREAEAMLSAP